MSVDDIKKAVLEALKEVAPEVDIESLDANVSFRDQVEIDSVDFLNFAIALDEKLGVTIPEIDYPKLSSLNGSVTYLQNKMDTGAAAATA